MDVALIYPRLIKLYIALQLSKYYSVHLKSNSIIRGIIYDLCLCVCLCVCVCVDELSSLGHGNFNLARFFGDL